jgi:hypothetical protein
MAMTDQEQKELRFYCAFLLKEYGFQFSPNDPVIPALYIIHKEMQLNNQNNKVIALVTEASSRINPKVFNFNSPGEAWKFQIGMAFKWILSGFLALMLIWIAAWRWSMANDVDRAEAIIEASGNVGELLKGVRKDKSGYYFIDFTAVKGDTIQFFKEFQRLNAKTVRVYLGNEPR